MNILKYNLNIVEKQLGINQNYIIFIFLSCFTMLLSATLVCFTIILTYNIEDKVNITDINNEDVIDNTSEIYAIPDDYINLNEIKGVLVHAGRYDEVPKNSKYDRFGLPIDRDWLTVSEWQGKHLKDYKDKSVFKTWKVIHMNTFLDYIKSAAKEESKVDEYKVIPASLIAGQAILESSFGISRLAVDANNLYGHKCHDCTDPDDYVVAYDDSPNDRFRIKKDKWKSIRDHSKLLMRKYYPRIPKSKRNNPDIKDWLNALCGCGRELSVNKAKKFKDKGNYSYATSCYTGKKGYARKLLNIIKLYKLDELDE